MAICFNTTRNRQRLAASVLLLLILYCIFYNKEKIRKITAEVQQGIEDGRISSQFETTSNETGFAELIVPNIVHFIVFNQTSIGFIHYVCILAALKNQRPDIIYFHTDAPKFQGQYWARLNRIEDFKKRLKIRQVEMPTEIFGREIQKKWQAFHASDVTRLRVLMEYGGIFLDNDSYIVRNLDAFRKFEMTIGWNEGEYLGDMLIIAHKKARFLSEWLNIYKGTYDTNKLYYNIGVLPTVEIIEKRPHLVHRVKTLFGQNHLFKLFQEYFPDWRQYYAFHLLQRHQYMLHNISLEATYPVEFNEFNLQKYPITFREMANDALDYERSKDRMLQLANKSSLKFRLLFLPLKV